MHGLGNDYIYIDCTACRPPERIEELSREMSPRHSSVGSDGIILILPSEIADFRMRIFNADGSEAKMCGNGSRCVGKYVYDHHLTTKTTLTLETNSGVKHLNLTINKDTDTVCEVTVDMGAPDFERQVYAQANSTELRSFIDQPIMTSIGECLLTAVSMGNPHGVIFIDNNIDNLDLASIGPELENHPIWPDRANIEFINVIDPLTIKMRVWERGSGETMACGTGACASAVAFLEKTGRLGVDGSTVNVKLKGGDLSISVNPSDLHVLMTGPAEEVYNATYRRKK